MPGIEQIVKDTSEEKPFKILEIVDDTSEAEIGYYVSGQEPYVKLYEYKYTDSDGQEQTMKFQSLEEDCQASQTGTSQRICHECEIR